MFIGKFVLGAQFTLSFGTTVSRCQITTSALLHFEELMRDGLREMKDINFMDQRRVSKVSA